MRKLLAGELPGLRRVETRSLHRGVAGARHGFMEVPPGANKLDMLRQARARRASRRAGCVGGVGIEGIKGIGMPCDHWVVHALASPGAGAERGSAAGRPWR